MKIAIIIFIFIIGYSVSMFKVLYSILVKKDEKPEPLIKNKLVRNLLMVLANIIVLVLLIYLIVTSI